MPHRVVFAGASSTQLQPARTTNYAYARRAAPCGRPTRGLHAREARLHAGFGDRDVRVRHCRGPHQNQELINSADSRMLDRSSPYLTHQRIECKTRTQGPYEISRTSLRALWVGAPRSVTPGWAQIPLHLPLQAAHCTVCGGPLPLGTLAPSPTSAYPGPCKGAARRHSSAQLVRLAY